MIDTHVAIDQVLAQTPGPTRTRTSLLDSAMGYILACDVASPINVPAVPTSIMVCYLYRMILSKLNMTY